MATGVTKPGVIVMVALLALRAYPLLTPPVQGAGHMGGDKPGRNGNNGVSDQDENGGQDAAQRCMRRDIPVATVVMVTMAQ
mgnify:CR=1 FL=1